jgi:uncharacterized protein YutE (UPF0331/DUF86 family)
MDDVVVNKVAIIERCVARVCTVHGGDDSTIESDQTKQDSIILNIQRACEAAIDLGMHLVRSRRLGIPQDSRDAFALLEGEGIIDGDLSIRLQRMVGFRNIAIHDYRELDLEIVKAVVRDRLDDLLEFAKLMLALGAET